MSELADILNRALEGRLELTFADATEAKGWVYRAHNYIRRKDLRLKVLMIQRRGTQVFVGVPQMHVEER